MRTAKQSAVPACSRAAKVRVYTGTNTKLVASTARASQGATVLPELMTAKEVAEYLGTTTRTLRRWAKEGRLRPIPLGSGIRFLVADVLRLVNAGKHIDGDANAAFIASEANPAAKP